MHVASFASLRPKLLGAVCRLKVIIVELQPKNTKDGKPVEIQPKIITY
jgi:hypothetical protein